MSSGGPHLDIRETENGSVFAIKVSPGAAKNLVGGLFDGALRVKVTTAPEKGKANKSVIALLAKTLNISKSNLEIASGETSSSKKVLVKGVKSAKLLELLCPYFEK